MSVDLVVVGLGYVGLPLALEATRNGLTVVGLDSSPQIVAGLNVGTSHVDDISDAELTQALGTGFLATTDPEVLAQAANIVICVPTPLTASGGPDLAAVHAALDAVAVALQPGQLVVLESTTYPGTTDEIARPKLEAGGLVAGVDFHLAFSPERIDPGNALYGVANTPKVVGGVTPGCTTAAVAFYGRFIERVVPARGAREAELAKLLENTYRHVNIALVNELARFCHELDIDIWDVIELAATKPFGFQAFYPGPGVGGHCIPIDPLYLAYKVRTDLGEPSRFIELAQGINSAMPEYVAARCEALLARHGMALSGASVLLLGITYKRDIADTRETPATPVARALLAGGARVTYHDPYVPHWRVADRDFTSEPELLTAVEQADLVVLLQAHESYDLEELANRAKLVFDTRGRLTAGERVERL